jgi:ATP-dependent RNA helicase DDX5/DBP2
MIGRVLRVFSSEALPNSSAFSSFKFPTLIENILKAKKFEKPTDIQKRTWPIALEGKDLIGIAQTGSGKTLGYLLPMITHLLNANNNNMSVKKDQPPNGLILLPTRELANQVSSELTMYGGLAGVRHTAVYGGASRYDQKFSLKRGNHAIVGTPGRIVDFLSDNCLDLSKVNYLVIDEADLMFDMGFESIVRTIISTTAETRQTLMFTATWPKEIAILSSDLMNDPEKVQIGSSDFSMNENITHRLVYSDDEDKFKSLLTILNENPESKYLIFMNTKKQAEELKMMMKTENIVVDTLHSDKDQRQRNVAMRLFTMNKIKILIATDVASRGLDIKNIDFVINYEIPPTLDDFIHRVGRTARAGSEGVAITFYSNKSRKNVMKGIMKKLREVNQSVPTSFTEIALEEY